MCGPQDANLTVVIVFIVCLVVGSLSVFVSKFRYSSLAPLALACFAGLRVLRPSAGASYLQCAENKG